MSPMCMYVYHSVRGDLRTRVWCVCVREEGQRVCVCAFDDFNSISGYIKAKDRFKVVNLVINICEVTVFQERTSDGVDETRVSRCRYKEGFGFKYHLTRRDRRS